MRRMCETDGKTETDRGTPPPRICRSGEGQVEAILRSRREDTLPVHMSGTGRRGGRLRGRLALVLGAPVRRLERCREGTSAGEVRPSWAGGAGDDS